MPLRNTIRVAALASLVLAVVSGVVLGVALCEDLHPPANSAVSAGTTTQQHLRTSPWWPTKPAPTQQNYVGTAACATCHTEIAASQATSQMAHTLTHPADSPILDLKPLPEYHAGPYTYTLEHHARQATLSVTDTSDRQVRSAVLEWAFGSGDVGQSYLWQKDGAFRESRFNYFSSIHTLAATPGRLHGVPTSIEMAIGRPVEPFEARTCFSCHVTSMSSKLPLDLKTVVPGVSCDSCHGPGAEHVAAVQAHDANPDPSAPWDRHIVNSGKLSPAQSVDFCGACHSTPWDVRVMGAVGLQTVRFPAYRLEKSRCWGTAGDARLTCTGCHDPHQPLERQPAAYDAACLSCHARKLDPAHAQPVADARSQTVADARSQTVADAHLPGKACPVAASKCTTCHMPKVNLPEMHSSFTDHDIRIARNGSSLPD